MSCRSDTVRSSPPLPVDELWQCVQWVRTISLPGMAAPATGTIPSKSKSHRRSNRRDENVAIDFFVRVAGVLAGGGLQNDPIGDFDLLYQLVEFLNALFFGIGGDMDVGRDGK